jgi:hypothetical protein
MELDASDLRAEIGRRRITIYKLAAAVGVYPGRLGQMLNERIPLPSAVAERVAAAIAECDARAEGKNAR